MECVVSGGIPHTVVDRSAPGLLIDFGQSRRCTEPAGGGVHRDGFDVVLMVFDGEGEIHRRRRWINGAGKIEIADVPGLFAIAGIRCVDCVFDFEKIALLPRSGKMNLEILSEVDRIFRVDHAGKCAIRLIGRISLEAVGRIENGLARVRGEGVGIHEVIVRVAQNYAAHVVADKLGGIGERNIECDPSNRGVETGFLKLKTIGATRGNQKSGYVKVCQAFAIGLDRNLPVGSDYDVVESPRTRGPSKPTILLATCCGDAGVWALSAKDGATGLPPPAHPSMRSAIGIIIENRKSSRAHSENLRATGVRNGIVFIIARFNFRDSYLFRRCYGGRIASWPEKGV